VDCTSARAALSARLDGEPAEPGLDAHLSGCPACRAYEQEVTRLTRRLRLAPAPEPVDLAARVQASARAERPRAPWTAERWLLAAVGGLMLLLAAVSLVTGGGAHLLREAGVTDLALAVGVLTAAVQPWRAAGVLPVVVVLAAGLTVTSLADVLSGQVAPVDEAAHVLAPTAALLLWLLRRQVPGTTATPPGELRVLPEDRRSA
jgi:predicted anti-sigma-YlaC factor YlaD